MNETKSKILYAASALFLPVHLPEKERMQRKSKILYAASALFLEGGLAALSVRAISKKAGLSTIGIYSHIKCICTLVVIITYAVVIVVAIQ